MFVLSIFSFRHVQVNNETALSFYKKFSFKIISTASNYYQRLEPADAYLLERQLTKNLSADQLVNKLPISTIQIN